eukprot:1352457-Heterocapsa_arctica.AAC.1
MTAMAGALPDGPAPPKMLMFDFDFDVDFDNSSRSSGVLAISTCLAQFLPVQIVFTLTNCGTRHFRGRIGQRVRTIVPQS